MSSNSRAFAIVPAAGMSRRMGRPKLTLPWPTKSRPQGLLIDLVLEAWTSSRVTETLVVLRADDEALTRCCAAWPVRIVQADPAPRDMKASIQLALKQLQSDVAPQDADRCFIAPADLPGLQKLIIDQLLATPSDSDRIVVPRFGDEEGHPALLPWPIAQEVFCLGQDEGVNKITRRHPKTAVSFDAALRFGDVDTMEEYRSAFSRWGTE